MVDLINPFNKLRLRKSNGIFLDEQGNKFPVIDGVARFVSNENYTANFGFQWNLFQETQLDHNIEDINFSKIRFLSCTGWDNEDLTKKNILEVGSGAGRFSKVVLEETQANLYSIDYSDAVSANFRNNGKFVDRFHLFQASIYEMPFPDNTFDKVFCFGVLQHTPDFKQSVKCLIDKVKPGGEVVVDFYPIKGWWTKVQAKYILRPWTKRLNHQKLLRLIDKNLNGLIKTYKLFDFLKVGKLFNRFLPICDINSILHSQLSDEEKREWILLDTFDMFSPEHDHPQRISTVKKWFQEYGMDVTFAGTVTYKEGMSVAIVKGFKRK